MHIEISGGSKLHRRLIKNLAEYVGYKLMGNRLAPKIELRIVLNKDLMNSEGVHGYCMPMDDEVRPKEFEIELDYSGGIDDLLVTLCHEMVHVKQYARDELRELVFKKCHRFNGEYIPHDVPYDSLPWEIEAEERQRELYLEWFLGDLESRKAYS